MVTMGTCEMRVRYGLLPIRVPLPVLHAVLVGKYNTSESLEDARQGCGSP